MKGRPKETLFHVGHPLKKAWFIEKTKGGGEGRKTPEEKLRRKSQNSTKKGRIKEGRYEGLQWG